MGLKSKQGKSFGKTSIYSIIRNPKYCGIYEFNSTPSRNVDGSRNSHARKPESEIIRVEDAFPAIISKDDFDTVQRMLDGRKKKSGQGRAKEVYLLSGKIICGECGMAYVGHRRFNSMKKKYIFYSCGKNQRQKLCNSRGIRREYIERYVMKQLADYIFDDSLVPKLATAYQQHLLSLNQSAVSELKRYKSRLRAIDKEIGNIVSVITKTGSIALSEKLSALENEKIEVGFKLEKITADTSVSDISEEEIRKSFLVARQLFLTGELATTKKLISMYVENVVIFEEKIELKVKIKPDLSVPLQKELDKSGSHYSNTNLCSYGGAHST